MASITENSVGEFLRHVALPTSQMMWFLGAGSSRTAGMPTAYDLIWDLKQTYYCSEENQDINSHDINNKAIRNKIQTYMDSRSFPSLDSAEEYSFYFELLFGNDYSAQRQYLSNKLSSKHLSANIGHKALTSLMAANKAKMVFTTNFDEVIEHTYGQVAGSSLNTFHLDGSSAALAALNSDNFPIYVKLHGDFKYTKLKNLSSDLQANDLELQKCFLAASNRFGLIISGYSGRDNNVMRMLNSALDQPNPFPHGIFWTTTNSNNISKPVKDFIDAATAKGVFARVIEIGTFDELLSKIWRQLPDIPKEFNSKIFSSRNKAVSIPLPKPGTAYPIIRTNALPIIALPQHCGVIETSQSLTYADLKAAIREHQPKAIITLLESKIFFWGELEEVHKVIDSHKITSVGIHNITDPNEWLNNTFIQSFFEEALSLAVSSKEQLLLRKNNRTYYVVIKHEFAKDEIFLPLEDALTTKWKKETVRGNVMGLKNVSWAEAVSLKLEPRNGRIWLTLKPDIWISPLAARQDSTDFLRDRRKGRFNKTAYAMLDAWINIILGNVGNNGTSIIECYGSSKFSAKFEIGTRTAYSRKLEK